MVHEVWLGKLTTPVEKDDFLATQNVEIVTVARSSTIEEVVHLYLGTPSCSWDKLSLDIIRDVKK